MSLPPGSLSDPQTPSPAHPPTLRCLGPLASPAPALPSRSLSRLEPRPVLPAGLQAPGARLPLVIRLSPALPGSGPEPRRRLGNVCGTEEWMGKLRPSRWQSWDLNPRLYREKRSNLIPTTSGSGKPVRSPSTQEAQSGLGNGTDWQPAPLSSQDRLPSPALTSTVLHDHRKLSGAALWARGLERPEVQRAWGRSGRAARSQRLGARR